MEKVEKTSLGLIVNLIAPEVDFFGLVDVEDHLFPLAAAPISYEGWLVNQGLQFVDELAAWNGIGPQTHQVVCLLLAINEFEVVFNQKTMEMPESVL